MQASHNNSIMDPQPSPCLSEASVDSFGLQKISPLRVPSVASPLHLLQAFRPAASPTNSPVRRSPARTGLSNLASPTASPASPVSSRAPRSPRSPRSLRLPRTANPSEPRVDESHFSNTSTSTAESEDIFDAEADAKSVKSVSTTSSVASPASRQSYSKLVNVHRFSTALRGFSSTSTMTSTASSSSFHTAEVGTTRSVRSGSVSSAAAGRRYSETASVYSAGLAVSPNRSSPPNSPGSTRSSIYGSPNRRLQNSNYRLCASNSASPTGTSSAPRTAASPFVSELSRRGSLSTSRVSASSSTRPESQISVPASASASASASEFSASRHSRSGSVSTPTSSGFFISNHSFSTASLPPHDTSICLSFPEAAPAFVYAVDDSGWADALLLASNTRGWIPINYFSPLRAPLLTEILFVAGAFLEVLAVDEDSAIAANGVDGASDFGSSSATNFTSASHQQSHSRRIRKKYQTYVQALRDETTRMLKAARCHHRNDDLVARFPRIHARRKDLLTTLYVLVEAVKSPDLDWTLLAESLRGYVAQTVCRAGRFHAAWVSVSRGVFSSSRLVYCGSAPKPSERIAELRHVLTGYLGLLLGRLDLAETRQQAAEPVDELRHHVVFLFRELLATGKQISDRAATAGGAASEAAALIATTGRRCADLAERQFPDAVKDLLAMLRYTPRGGRGVRTSRGAPGPRASTARTVEGSNMAQILAELIRALGSYSDACMTAIVASGAAGDAPLSAKERYVDVEQYKVDFAEFIVACGGAADGSNESNGAVPTPNNEKSGTRQTAVSADNSELNFGAAGSSATNSAILKSDDAASASAPAASSDAEACVSFRNNKISAATLPGLVQLLTDPTPPPSFPAIFFTTFRLFTTPLDLADALIARATPHNGNPANSATTERVLNIFCMWLESYWNWDQDAFVLAVIINFTNEAAAAVCPAAARSVIETAARRCRDSSPRQLKPLPRLPLDAPLNSTAPVSPVSPVGSGPAGPSNPAGAAAVALAKTWRRLSRRSDSGLGKQHHRLLAAALVKFRSQTQQLLQANKQRIRMGSDVVANWKNLLKFPCRGAVHVTEPILTAFPASEIAAQLTVLEARLYNGIPVSEFLDPAGGRQLRYAAAFTNQLSAFVIHSVVQPGLSHSTRSSIVAHWINVAFHVCAASNFNSLMAIMVSLLSAQVTQLSKIWDALPSRDVDLFGKLSKIALPNRNFGNYRSLLRDTGAAIPYLGVVRSDVLFVTEGMPDLRRPYDAAKAVSAVNVAAPISRSHLNHSSPARHSSADAEKSSGGSLINFEKFSRLAGILAQLQPFDCSIEPQEDLMEWILFQMWSAETDVWGLSDDILNSDEYKRM